MHKHSGVTDASAEGTVTFPDAGGANVSVTVTDRDEDGWCADAWVTSNLPANTHKQYQVCNVAKQATYSLALPATARCDVTFVEVQVGRVDPSNNNKTELGDTKRIENPCPPLPPAPTPAPPPPPAPPATITAPVRDEWVAARRWTRNVGLSVAGVPAGASVQLRCHGHGCPGTRRTVTVRNGKADIHRVLKRRHLRPGAVLEVWVTRADMIGKVRRFKVRRSHVPSAQTLCVAPGATTPARC